MQTIAHRGASGYAPENTRAAFERAIEMGSTAIETDLRMTTDGRLILFHDGTVDRTSDGSGPVDDYSLAELRQLDLGSWFGVAYAGQRVLTLEEAVEEFLPRIPFVFEIKDGRVTRSLIECLRDRHVLDRVQITSFLWYPLLEARNLDAGATLGFLTPSFEPSLVERIVARGFNQICPHVSRLSHRQVDAAHDQGLTVRAWGIDQRVQVERLFETGADGATINWPDWILAEPRVTAGSGT